LYHTLKAAKQMPTHLAGPLDVEIGTLSCTPAVADIRTRGGSISVASFDGLAKLTTTSRRPGAHVTVHGQDNLALLWLDAVHASVNLTLSPELAKKVWCYTLPAVGGGGVGIVGEGGLRRGHRFLANDHGGQQ
jgi:hypothetical protein